MNIDQGLPQNNLKRTEDGKYIYRMEDGSFDIIIAVEPALTVLSKDAKESQLCGHHPRSRRYYDTVQDATQNGYLAVYPLNTRFYTPMPNTQIGVFTTASIITAERGKSEIYHCDSDILYRVGFFKSEYQVNRSLTDLVTDMVNVNQYTTVLCVHSTYTIEMAKSVVEKTEYGEAYLAIPDPISVSKSIGMVETGNFSETDNGSIIIFTNEPSVREFNGTEYTPNVADGKVQKSHIEKFDLPIVIDYDNVFGINIWGYRV
jgi:hypothetical protein